MSEHPLVSLCIPTYKGAKYLLETLRSAVNQTYPNLEFIISDDASKDNSLKIVKNFFADKQLNFKVISNVSAGIGSNWNNCVKHSSGEYIKFLMQDDILLENCVEEMMTLMTVSKKVGLVYCKRGFIDQDGIFDEFIKVYGNLHKYWGDFEVKGGILPGNTYLKDSEFLNSPKNKIGEPTCVLLRTECFRKVGYFAENMYQALDSDFWYRTMKYFQVGFIDEELVKFRLHRKQASIINKSKGNQDKNLIYKRYYDLLFWYLHPRCQWKLLKLYNPLIKFMLNSLMMGRKILLAI